MERCEGFRNLFCRERVLAGGNWFDWTDKIEKLDAQLIIIKRIQTNLLVVKKLKSLLLWFIWLGCMSHRGWKSVNMSIIEHSDLYLIFFFFFLQKRGH
jgi:hypothetical protein